MRLTGDEQPAEPLSGDGWGRGGVVNNQIWLVLSVLLALAQLVVMLLHRGC
jgi:hypothetical protein